MGIGDSFILNEFMFCTDHGREYCISCFCDYREGNNLQIEFDEGILERFENLFIGIDKRPAIDAFALGAKLANKQQETYKCAKHGTIDCGDCYNWTRRIVQALEVLEKLRGEPGSSKPNRVKVNEVD